MAWGSDPVAKASSGWGADPIATASSDRALADARKRAASTPDQVRAIATGASFGLNDEMDALSAAAETGVNNVIRKVTGKPGVGYTAKDAFHAVMQAEREKTQGFRGEHPAESAALELGGGLASPGLRAATGLIKNAATFGGAVKRSAAVGGAYGALAGAGNADGGLIDRAKGAGAGLIAGTAFGGAVPVAARGAVGLIKAGGGAVTEAASSLSRAVGNEPVAKPLTPEQSVKARETALRYVNSVVQKSGKSLEDIEAHPAEAMGKPITAAEAIGRNGMYQLQTLGKRAGSTPDSLEGALEARRIDAPNRLTADISDTLQVHPEAARGSIETLVDQGQKAAKPLFDAALSHPGPITTPALKSLAQRPVIQRALGRVAAEMMNAGEDPHAFGLEVTGMSENGLPASVTLKAPTAATWDRVKKAVGGLVERHPITGKPLPNSVSSGNRDIAVASGDLTSALKEAIPGYGDALAKSGDYLSHQAAFERVKGAVFKTAMPQTDFAKMWAGFSPSQAEAARAAIANDFHLLAQNNRLSAKLFNTPSVRAKLTTAFGSVKTDALIARVEQEALLAKGQRMTPGTNSTTGETAFTGEDQDGMGLIAARAAGHAVTGDVHGAARHIGRAVVEGLLAPARGASTPLAQGARDEVGRLLQLRPSELAAELRAHQATGGRRIVRRGTRAAPVAASGAGGYAATVVNNP